MGTLLHLRRLHLRKSRGQVLLRPVPCGGTQEEEVNQERWQGEGRVPRRMQGTMSIEADGDGMETGDGGSEERARGGGGRRAAGRLSHIGGGICSFQKRFSHKRP